MISTSPAPAIAWLHAAVQALSVLPTATVSTEACFWPEVPAPTGHGPIPDVRRTVKTVRHPFSKIPVLQRVLDIGNHRLTESTNSGTKPGHRRCRLLLWPRRKICLCLHLQLYRRRQKFYPPRLRLHIERLSSCKHRAQFRHNIQCCLFGDNFAIRTSFRYCFLGGGNNYRYSYRDCNCDW